MNTPKNLLLLAVAFWGGHAAGQSRLFDRVAVDFPNDVNVAGKVLHAGSYEIRQLRNSASGARVLFVTDKGGTGFEAEAATIPVLDNLTPTRTHLVLRRSGGLDYLRQVWIAGKNYGYEFNIPDQGRLAAGVNDVTLTATYTAEAPAVVAQNQPEPAREATPSAAPAPAAPSPSPAPPAEQAQVQNPPPTSEPEPAPGPGASSSANEDAQRATQPAPANRLPTTAMNWMAYLIGGVLLLAAGALLNVFAARSQG